MVLCPKCEEEYDGRYGSTCPECDDSIQRKISKSQNYRNIKAIGYQLSIVCSSFEKEEFGKEELLENFNAMVDDIKTNIEGIKKN